MTRKEQITASKAMKWLAYSHGEALLTDASQAKREEAFYLALEAASLDDVDLSIPENFTFCNHEYESALWQMGKSLFPHC
jgi:hypothetical protein